ncbi:MAG TPA: hypothetical protein VI386_06925 [Candidatus Sulfotelmatobacter sp.]
MLRLQGTRHLADINGKIRPSAPPVILVTTNRWVDGSGRLASTERKRGDTGYLKSVRNRRDIGIEESDVVSMGIPVHVKRAEVPRGSRRPGVFSPHITSVNVRAGLWLWHIDPAVHLQRIMRNELDSNVRCRFG